MTCRTSAGVCMRTTVTRTLLILTKQGPARYLFEAGPIAFTFAQLSLLVTVLWHTPWHARLGLSNVSLASLFLWSKFCFKAAQTCERPRKWISFLDSNQERHCLLKDPVVHVRLSLYWMVSHPPRTVSCCGSSSFRWSVTRWLKRPSPRDFNLKNPTSS